MNSYKPLRKLAPKAKKQINKVAAGETAKKLIKSLLTNNGINVEYADILYDAIKRVITIEMNDNEYMKNQSIILSAKRTQLEYFLQNAQYKLNLVDALQKAYQEESESGRNKRMYLIIDIIMSYDPQVFPSEWENESKRLTSSIIEQCEPNSVRECPKCGKQTINVKGAQVRSGDEGETAFFTCCNCGYKWQEG